MLGPLSGRSLSASVASRDLRRSAGLLQRYQPRTEPAVSPRSLSWRPGARHSTPSTGAAATADSGGGGSSRSAGGPFLPAMDLSVLDRSLVRLYMAGCFHYWEQLPELAREALSAGVSAEELRGCVRHLVVFAGYGPCLAATLALHKAKLLPQDTPAKVSGPPGNAFELVYGGVTDKVRVNMHAADPALGEWIRLHLYGDLYSSPGLDMRQKQLLTCAFLAEAHMPDQLFGHALAGLRFGNSVAALEEVLRLACDMGPRMPDSRRSVLKAALRTLDMAFAKFQKDMADQPPTCPEVSIQDPEVNVCIPPLPPLLNPPPVQQGVQPARQGVQPPAQAGTSGGVGADASVSVSSAAAGLKGAGSGSKPGVWGTSNIRRPGNLAVDVIAARMEQERVRSGLFFGWDPLDDSGLPPGLNRFDSRLDDEEEEEAGEGEQEPRRR